VAATLPQPWLLHCHNPGCYTAKLEWAQVRIGRNHNIINGFIKALLLLLPQVYQESVPGYRPGCYTAKLEWAVSEDGTAVPLTVAYRSDLMKKDGSNKALMHGWANTNCL
jgi:hypothetical protein